MTKKVLLIVASKNFQPIEYGVPRQLLEDEDIKVYTASDKNEAVSSDGSKIKVDYLLQDVKAEDFDGIFLVGGSGALEHLDNKNSYKIIQDVDKLLHKVYGSICISTRILAHAGVLDGRKVTGWDEDHKLKGILQEAGAEYVQEGVIVDRNLVTAQGPHFAQDFAQAILKVLYSNY